MSKTYTDEQLKKLENQSIELGQRMILQIVKELLNGEPGASSLNAAVNEEYQAVKKMIQNLRAKK